MGKRGVKEGVGVVVVVRWTSLGCGRRAPRVVSGVLAGYANSRNVSWLEAAAGVASGKDGRTSRQMAIMSWFMGFEKWKKCFFCVADRKK